MNSISLIKRLFLVLTVVFFASCDDEFSELGADVVDGDIHNSIIKYNARINAYDRATGVVQSNNLDVNTLGVYDNPVFGKTTAHYVTQVEMATGSINPTLFTPTIDSVWIYVPYRSTLTTDATTTADAVYKLDSIYSSPNAFFSLDVRKNGFYLRESDGNSGGTEGQKYYSDYKSQIESVQGVSLLKNPADANFSYSPAVIHVRATYTDDNNDLHTNDTVQTLAPGMFFYLKEDVIGNDLFGPGAAGKLINNTVLKEYFRGLYFKATQNGTQSAYGAPNFDAGTITVKYTDKTSATVDTRISKTLTLNLAGNSINLFENEYTTAAQTTYWSKINSRDTDPVTGGNKEFGDDRLYIKGGAGSAAFIDIDIASLEALKPIAGKKQALVNEANLVFYIDENTTNGMGLIGTNGKKAHPVPRIFLYDINNKRPVYDYYTDGTTISSYPKYSKYVHDGLIDTVSGGGGRYKIRITDHINNLINKDSTNVRLGLVVTESISVITSGTLQSPWPETYFVGLPPVPRTVTTLPVASVMHPFGTVLYGANSSVPEDKRLKLEIYYTKPE